ncbi:hypothetical protein D9619_002128 [Psilocybe cf. subviscida]|uniref:Uncharacterized protein n=1 Tax=Psilocybe cf. subviscida TaxID=2480587 RepID=A0A8H5F3C1_9AGAR|nr:hypothetical protein D9619_002128 [Psilocybe cf. subviscida]
MATSYLPTRLLRSAQVFSSVVRAHNTHAVLIGGAAVMMHGHHRSTKDLDINLDKAPSRKLIKNLAEVGIILCKHPERKNRFSATVEETAPGERDGASIDIAVRPDVPRIVEAYGKEILGVLVPTPQYLLMMKIRTVCERPPGAHARIKQDMDDIFFLCGEIAVEDAKIDDELQNAVFPDTWDKFWKIAENNIWWDTKTAGEAKQILEDMGIRCAQTV